MANSNNSYNALESALHDEHDKLSGSIKQNYCKSSIEKAI